MFNKFTYQNSCFNQLTSCFTQQNYCFIQSTSCFTKSHVIRCLMLVSRSQHFVFLVIILFYVVKYWFHWSNFRSTQYSSCFTLSTSSIRLSTSCHVSRNFTECSFICIFSGLMIVPKYSSPIKCVIIVLKNNCIIQEESGIAGQLSVPRTLS